VTALCSILSRSAGGNRRTICSLHDSCFMRIKIVQLRSPTTHRDFSDHTSSHCMNGVFKSRRSRQHRKTKGPSRGRGQVHATVEQEKPHTPSPEDGAGSTLKSVRRASLRSSGVFVPMCSYRRHYVLSQTQVFRTRLTRFGLAQPRATRSRPS